MNKKRTRIINEMRETWADLQKVGLLNKKRIADFDALVQLQIKDLVSISSPSKQLRLGANSSQFITDS